MKMNLFIMEKKGFLKRELIELEKNWEFVYYLLKDQLAVELKELIENEGIDKKELAKRLGVKIGYIDDILNGEKISLKNIARILVALGATDVRIKIER